MYACRSERTKVGRALSGALVATLFGLALSNTGVIPSSAPQYGIVNRFMLPLAIPMLLFSADLQRVLRETGRLLPVFFAGSLATVLSTFVAISIVPLSTLGENGWKIAAGLCARHIGGAVNYVAVTVATGANDTAVSAGLAADNLICALYFSTLYALAHGIPPDPSAAAAVAPPQQQQPLMARSGSGGAAVAAAANAATPIAAPQVAQTAPAAAAAAKDGSDTSTGTAVAASYSFEDVDTDPDSEGWMDTKRDLTVGILYGTTAIALAAALCHVAHLLARVWGQPSMSIPLVTAMTVLLATAAPKFLKPLVSSAEGIAAILLQFFFAAIGANGSVIQVVRDAPALFAFAFIHVFVHLAALLTIGRTMGWPRRDVLLASNANVGGPTTAAGMAAAKGWRSSIVPSILMGTCGYAVATFVALALAPLLRRLSLGL